MALAIDITQEAQGQIMGRAINHTLISSATLAIVIAGLVLFDVRARRVFATLADDAPSSDLARLGASAMQVGTMVLTTLRDQSIANGPLMIFVVIATVLTLFMVRT